MRLWLIVFIVAYALMTFGCETYKGQKLGGKDSTYTDFVGYEGYGLTSD